MHNMEYPVERLTNHRWDPTQIKKDWEEKLLPLLPRNAQLPASDPIDAASSDYSYAEMPVIRDYVRGTVFEDILNSIPGKRGRCTFLTIPPSFCLRHHRDPDNKFHIAIDDNPACFYVDLTTQQSYKVPTDGYLYKIHARNRHHTAVNAGVSSRTHLVVQEYVCEDSTPTALYTSKVKMDYNNCILEKNAEKASIPNTLEQAFGVEWLSSCYYTGKVYTNAAHNGYGEEENTRTYVTEWICENTMNSMTKGVELIKWALNVKQLGVDMYVDVGYGYKHVLR